MSESNSEGEVTNKAVFNLMFETVIANPTTHAELKLFVETYDAERFVNFLCEKYGFNTIRGWDAHDLVRYFQDNYNEGQK